MADVHAGGPSEALEPVVYGFRAEGVASDWRVVRVSYRSEISQVYQLELELVCDDVDAPVDELLGASCELTIERGESVHAVHGLVSELDDVGPDQERLHAAVRVIPALGMLAHQIDTRIFQGQTVLEILSEVLGEALGAYGRQLDLGSCIERSYDRRDYCTQFRESTLDFCCRLMEQEGIAFYFVADDAGRRERLVLADDNAGYPGVEPVGGDDVPIIDHDPEQADCESIRGLRWTQRHHVEKVVGRAYNFKRSGAFDEHQQHVEGDDAHRGRELYLHDDRRQITDDPIGDPSAQSFDGTALPQRERVVEQALQEHRSKTRVGRGRGNVTGFRPGARFRLGEHHRGELDGADLLLLRVEHRGAAPVGDGPGGASYENEFTVIPHEQPYRPPQRTRVPRVYGSQLAKVVGPPGQEIHTDPYGRIKIQFHHDRLQPRNETASCWVRVVQPWAGPQWGSFFIPRIGMEVVVQFVDGDPDQPVVVGSVYDSENMPPYPMPDEKTKSTIKTSSSPGGGGYNELTFEDAAGSEQIIIHAQKDFNETVEHDHSTTVHANQTNSVDVDQSISVGGDQSISVTGDHTETVTGSATVTVHQDRTTTIDQNETLTVKCDRSETVEGNVTIVNRSKRSLTVTDATTQTFENGRETTVLQADDELFVQANKSIGVMGAYHVTVAKPYSVTQQQTESITLDGSIAIRSGSRVEVTNGKCTMTMEGGVLSLDAPTALNLTCGGASIGLGSDGTVTISGAVEVGIAGADATGRWSSSGFEASGARLDLSTGGVASLSGTMVKIN